MAFYFKVGMIFVCLEGFFFPQVFVKAAHIYIKIKNLVFTEILFLSKVVTVVRADVYMQCFRDISV